MPRKANIQEIMEKMWVPPRDLVTLGVVGSEKTVYNWISSGKSPIPTTKFGHRRLFKLSDVLTYLEKNNVVLEAE